MSQSGGPTGRNNLVGAGIMENRFKSNKAINYTANSALPNIGFKDKNQELIEKETKEIEKSLRQFKTLKDINDILLKSTGVKTNPNSPLKHLATNSYHTESRDDLRSRKQRSPNPSVGGGGGGLNNVPSKTSLNS